MSLKLFFRHTSLENQKGKSYILDDNLNEKNEVKAETITDKKYLGELKNYKLIESDDIVVEKFYLKYKTEVIEEHDEITVVFMDKILDYIHYNFLDGCIKISFLDEVGVTEFGKRLYELMVSNNLEKITFDSYKKYYTLIGTGFKNKICVEMEDCSTRYYMIEKNDEYYEHNIYHMTSGLTNQKNDIIEHVKIEKTKTIVQKCLQKILIDDINSIIINYIYNGFSEFYFF